MADIGVRGFGESLEGAFEQTALALTAAVCDLHKVQTQDGVAIACEAADVELLLVEWLNALVYEMATRKMLFGRFDVHMNEHQLQATVWGEPVARERHQPAVEVKGATYTELKVGRSDDGLWLAQCVIDV